jgi:3-hydroxybutyryl-CoA dehydrogenase
LAAERLEVTEMRVGVIGGGLMGSGIAEVCARAGTDVTVIEVDQARLDAARESIDRSLGRAVRAGKLSVDAQADALARMAFATDLDAAAGADAAIEAIVESESAKGAVFKQLDQILPDARFLASNTSSVPIMKLAAETTRPERVLGLHFFNPVPVLTLVEVVRSIMTSDEVLAEAKTFVGELGKQVIDSQDRAGFVVNALLVPYILSAIRMYESGFASKEDIDRGMVLGCAHPMGPLALADLIGLDTLQSVAESMHDEFRDASNVPPPLLNRMVEAGLLGRKTRRGFYDYAKA